MFDRYMYVLGYGPDTICRALNSTRSVTSGGRIHHTRRFIVLQGYSLILYLPCCCQDQAINLSNGDGVTKTQAARELLSAIKKNPNHKAFRTALTTFTQQLLSQMTAPAQPVEPSAGQAAAAAAVNAVMESALLLQLQMLGTSAGMQIFVPGVT